MVLRKLSSIKHISEQFLSLEAVHLVVYYQNVLQVHLVERY